MDSYGISTVNMCDAFNFLLLSSSVLVIVAVVAVAVAAVAAVDRYSWMLRKN